MFLHNIFENFYVEKSYSVYSGPLLKIIQTYPKHKNHLKNKYFKIFDLSLILNSLPSTPWESLVL